MMKASENLDEATVRGFGDEWTRFDQSVLTDRERQQIFDDYFHIFPWHRLPESAHGFDLGCGSGRWALLVSERVGQLTCIDAAEAALEVAQRNLASRTNVRFSQASVESIPLPDESQDFGYSLGVLHHVPDTAAAIRACVRKLKPNAPFLLYLYYALENRPVWFRGIWRATNVVRQAVSVVPEAPRQLVTDLIAGGLYLPLARTARSMERMGIDVSGFPLSYYRNTSFYTMRTDARDRFGTRLEQRFTRDEIERMMREAGLADIRFSERAPYWCAVGYRQK